MDVIDSKYEAGVNKRSYYSIPLQANDIILMDRGAYLALKKALEELGLKDTVGSWSYDPKGFFSYHLNDQVRPPKFTIDIHPKVEAHANLVEDGPFQPIGTTAKAIKSKWRAFYQAVTT